MAFERKYSDETRAAAVREALRRRQADPGNRSVIREVAAEFEVGPQSLRQWLARADDGSYDYDVATHSSFATEPPLSAQTKAELLRRVARLGKRVEELEADNHSLTRVIAMLTEQLQDARSEGR